MHKFFEENVAWNQKEVRFCQFTSTFKVKQFCNYKHLHGGYCNLGFIFNLIKKRIRQVKIRLLKL